MNIFDYLQYPELKEIFANVVLDHEKIIGFFEENKNLKTMIRAIKFLSDQNVFSKKENEKSAYIIIIFILIDDPCYNFIKRNSTILNQICLDKYHMLHDDSIENIELTNFLNRNFDKGKRFFTKRSNKKYRSRMFKARMKCILFVLYIRDIALHNRYKPFGTGYFQALNEFNQLSN